MAIDSDETIRPEDAFTVAEYGDGSFYVAVSFPEVGILDPEADTIKLIARSIMADPDKPPKCKIPKAKNKMHYGNDREIPSLTVQGVFRPDRGITNANIIRSRVKPALFRYGDIDELKQNPHYKLAEKFAYVFAKYQTKANTPDARVHRTRYSQILKGQDEISPSIITEQFMVFANMVTGELSEQAGLTQIYRVQEARQQLRPSTYDSSPGFHESANAEACCDMSNPVRQLGSWIVHVTISRYLSNSTVTDEPAITDKEMSAIVHWRNNQRHARIGKDGTIVSVPA